MHNSVTKRGRLRTIAGATLVGVWLITAGCAAPERLREPAKLVELTTSLPVKRDWLKVMLSEQGRVDYSLNLTVDERYFYWSDRRGRLHALSVHNGRETWIAQPEDPISSRPGGTGELLLYGTRGGEAVAVRKTDGVLVWRSQLSSEILSQPRSAEGIVVVYCADGNIYGLDEINGGERWHYESKVPLLSLRGTADPVITEGRVILGLADGKLAAVDLWDGTLKWSAELATSRGRSELERMVDIDGTPVVDDGVVYAVAYQGRVAAVSLATGRLLWSRELSASLDLAVGAEQIYVVDTEGSVISLDKKTGSILWKQDYLQGRYLTAPRLYRDYIIVGDFEGYSHWLDRREGHLLHRQRSDDTPIDVAPVVAHDSVYMMSRGGVIDVMRLTSPAK